MDPTELADQEPRSLASVQQETQRLRVKKLKGLEEEVVVCCIATV